MNVVIKFPKSVDARNSDDFGREIEARLASYQGESIDEVTLDADELDYISSAGLRVLLKCKKKWINVSVINVSSAVFEIFETTGFTELLSVEKKLRNISVDGLPCIGKGANGAVYRLDDERIIKVYNPISNTIERIKREKSSARQAFIHDIPSAISYDIVKVGDRYGMIYEMIKAKTLGETIADSPDKKEYYARQMAKLLKKLHSTEFDDGVLPDARDGLMLWADIAARSGWYSDEIIEKLRGFIRSIPAANTFIHGDFHPGNIMVCDGELILIDMGDASVGDPVIDLLGSYQIMRLVTQRSGGAERYTGMSDELLSSVWDVFIHEYTGITDENELAKYENKLKFFAIIRSFAGVTFSELVPKETLPALTKNISEAFLRGLQCVR